MYVGVISDTHGVFSREFAEFLAPVDVIWHAGDWGGSLGFVQQIRDLGKPVVGVYGNCDGLDIREEFPEYQFFREEGLGILITHIGGSPGHYYPRAQQLLRACKPDIFVCGHSHILKVGWDDSFAGEATADNDTPLEGSASPARRGFLYMNPGAAGLQGWQVVRTALRFRLAEGRVSDLEVFNLPRNQAARM